MSATWLRALAFALLLVLGGTAALADGPVPVDGKTGSLDISQDRQLVVSSSVEASLLGLTEQAAVTVKAKGAGPKHYWSLFSFRNTTDKALSFVVSFQPQGFAGAGFLVPDASVKRVISAANLRDGAPLNLIDAGLWQYVYVGVPPGEATNIAVESSGAALNASLWRADLFGSAHTGPLFFIGVMQGMAILALAGLVGLYTFRPQRETLAGVLFGCSLLLFVEEDLGLFAVTLAHGAVSDDLLRAIVETALAATLALCVVTFHGPLLGRRVAYAATAGAIVAGGLANIAYAVIEPLSASTAARLIFVASVLAGCIMGFSFRKTKGTLGFAWLFWLALAGWTVLAAFVAGWGNIIAHSHIWLAGATLALLLVVALLLIRFVTELRRGDQPGPMRAELRSLALAAGQHIMWEWQPDRRLLHVGPELPRRLNLDPEAWEENARGYFHAVLHPTDLVAYQSLAERRDFKPGEPVSIELRVRGQDGVFHWYELQARAVRGAQPHLLRAIGTLTDIDRLKSATERLALDAVQDAITGLPNKALFVDRLDRVLAQLGGLPFRVVTVDIDRFKALNEGLGQEAGDLILKTVAGRLSGLLEPDETAARLNGGQFALHCAESLTRDFSDFLKKLENELAQPIKLGAQEVVISASIGISDPGIHGMMAQDLLDQSNVAMLEARKEGGARTAFYQATMTDDRARLFTLESDLRRALARAEIEIHYQPIVDLLTLQVHGFEALARWRHAELGLLPPADFMDIAETSGMMGEISQFMMAGAARQLGIWRRVHVRDWPFFVSVNISASQLVDPQFLGRVQQVLEREQPEPGSFKIEITETVIMRQPERSAQVLRQLRALGVGLACDDFGTGFSSLASLRDLPFDTLKIDRSFIAGEDFEERNAKIIGSITALAAGLNMAVIAEGIETQGQIDALAALGCTLGQGYLLGMPENADAATARLRGITVPAMLQEDLLAEAPMEEIEEDEPVSTLAAVELPSIFTAKEPPKAEEPAPAQVVDDTPLEEEAATPEAEAPVEEQAPADEPPVVKKPAAAKKKRPARKAATKSAAKEKA